MTRDIRTNELGIFLKARRAELTPRQAGLPDGAGTRRVAGLRREEVASLAAISTDYYTRIEQGRIQASGPVLHTLAEVLGLDDDQRRYLFSLAGKPSTRAPRQTVQQVKPQLRRLLDDLVATPAIVMGRRMDVLAWNRLAAEMITDFGQVPAARRNYVRILFTDPQMRTRYRDWESVAQTAVAQLRMEAAKYPDDPRLAALVGELSVTDPQFAGWWAARNVASLSTGTKTLVHPRIGELVLDWDTLAEAADADQQLVVWTAAPGSPTRQALQRLAAFPAASPADELPPGHGGPPRTDMAEAFLAKTAECFAAMAAILTALGDELANVRPDLPGANSCYAIANHCIGVVDYWAGSFIAGERIPRDRDAEFTAVGTVAELVDRLAAVEQRLPGWVDIATGEGVRDRDLADGVRGGTTRVEVLATATPEWALLHILQDLAQHVGHMEITRDLLLAGTS